MQRLVEFDVEHPNLNATPKNMKRGKKRFIFHKNNNSEGFNISEGRKVENEEYGVNNAEDSTSYIFKLKDLLYKKTKELQSLEKITNNMNNLKLIRASPTKLTSLRKEYNFTPDRRSGFSNSGLFFQQKYTKNNPKIFESNPIVGYSTRKALSPDRRLANYGNLIFNNSFK